jgi:ferritin-like metal-binding protein YciE
LLDVYYAEKRLTKILPKMAKKGMTSELADAFSSPATETEGRLNGWRR